MTHVIIHPHERARLEGVLAELETDGLRVGSPVTYTTRDGVMLDGIVTGFGVEAGAFVIDVMTEDGVSRWGYADQVRARPLGLKEVEGGE